ncbi:unnamed protein product [Rhodiola kirilowii]
MRTLVAWRLDEQIKGGEATTWRRRRGRWKPLVGGGGGGGKVAFATSKPSSRSSWEEGGGAAGRRWWNGVAFLPWPPLLQVAGHLAHMEITVQFNADVADGMQWKFIPTQREVRVKPGESALAFYTAENKSLKPITSVSTYNVTPMKMLLDWKGPSYDLCYIGMKQSIAAVYFNKIQCFCFEEQRLLPGEEVDMPVFFYIDPEFETDPRMDGINNIILSYTFFKAADD